MANIIEADVCHDLQLVSKSRCDHFKHIQSGKYYPPPINFLPTEILHRIFHLALYLWLSTPVEKDKKAENLAWSRSAQSLMSVPQPDVLSHVCSLWRQIVLSSPSLWSHLDIYTLGQLTHIPLSRSSAFLARAQMRELTLTFGFAHDAYHFWSNWAETESFCAAIGPRLKSLRLDNHTQDANIFVSILKASLSHARPGLLTELTLTDNIARTIPTLGRNSEGLSGWALPSFKHAQFSMLPHSLDEIVQSVQILRLKGLFFPWSSPAYRGLTDLQLLCIHPNRGHPPFIQAARLREILLACPGLRTFHFGIKIIGENPQATLPPVALNELEVLDIKSLSLELYEEFLPLLAPGNKPLILTCQTHLLEEPIPYCPALQEFFQRSTVAKLYISNGISIDDHQHFPLEHLLMHSPATLHTLGLERFKIIQHTPCWTNHLNELSPIQLECLCLKKCIIATGVLRDMSIKFPAQTLKLEAPEFKDIPNEAQVREEIHSMFPVVKWVRLAIRGIESWDMWDTYYDTHASGA